MAIPDEPVTIFEHADADGDRVKVEIWEPDDGSISVYTFSGYTANEFFAIVILDLPQVRELTNAMIAHLSKWEVS